MKRTSFIVASLCFWVAFSHADDKNQTRVFAITYDNKSIGKAEMKFQKLADGYETREVSLAAKGKVLLHSFDYAHVNREVWKNGALETVESKSSDDGKKTNLSIQLIKNGYRLTANDKVSAIGGSFVLSSGLSNPAGFKDGDEVLVVDCEDGSVSKTKYKNLGKFKQKILNQEIVVSKVKLSNGKDVDNEWTFDATGRPVHQSIKWDGYRVSLELIEVK